LEAARGLQAHGLEVHVVHAGEGLMNQQLDAQAGRVLRRSLERLGFTVHTGTRTLVGATPERHVSLHNGTAVMNPISGTYRYPASGPVLSEVMDFLADRKETDELYMVVDEELKMMARICDGGGRVVGPFLREMARLAHTEYLIDGHSDLDPRDILRETMFAPTVTGSPLESACRVISRYEPHGRGYYSGIAALIGRDAGGGESGPDLTRSKLVTSDVGGNKIGVVVRTGRPDKGMPRFELTEKEISSLSSFIHSEQIAVISKKGGRKGVDVSDLQTGNANAGKQ